jgi:hypothetical protein
MKRTACQLCARRSSLSHPSWPSTNHLSGSCTFRGRSVMGFAPLVESAAATEIGGGASQAIDYVRSTVLSSLFGPAGTNTTTTTTTQSPVVCCIVQVVRLQCSALWNCSMYMSTYIHTLLGMYILLPSYYSLSLHTTPHHTIPYHTREALPHRACLALRNTANQHHALTLLLLPCWLAAESSGRGVLFRAEVANVTIPNTGPFAKTTFGCCFERPGGSRGDG